MLTSISAYVWEGGSSVRGVAYAALNRETFPRVKDRISTVLNRPVLTESDKRTFYGLKSLVINDSRAETIQLAKNQILAKAKRTLLHDYGRRVPIGRSVLLAYAEFGRWLKKPVTVGTALSVMSIWTLAVTFSRFGLPWSELGYTSGFGAVFMTAVITARLTVNSRRLWLEHPARREAARELNRWLIETTLARRSPIRNEIEEFLSSSMDSHGKELNPKANAFLLRRRDWQSLQEAFYDTFRKGAPPLVFELGRRLGSSVADDLMRLGGKPGAALSQFSEVSRALGWGDISVDGDLSRNPSMTFTVRESPFCVANTSLENNRDSCHMIRGMMSGIAEEFYGWPCSSSEVECVRDGFDCCKIIVTQSIDLAAKKEGWNLSVLFPDRFPWSR